MSFRTLTSAFVTAIVITGVMASLVIRHHAKVQLDQNATIWQQPENQLMDLGAEHRRLSNLDAQVKSPSAVSHTAELLKLRTETEALRKQLADNDQRRPSRTSSTPDSDREEHKAQLERLAATRNLSTARLLSNAIRGYAREHQGEIPTDFDQAATYISKAYEARVKADATMVRGLDPSGSPIQHELPRTSEFEIVYKGSCHELTNVPEAAVAMIRERQSWPTPKGKAARVYVMVDGSAVVVESDDNFQSWEAEHVLPPQ